MIGEWTVRHKNSVFFLPDGRGVDGGPQRNILPRLIIIKEKNDSGPFLSPSGWLLNH